jgi:hypothetical protein
LAISVEVDTDFMAAREARTSDDPIDAIPTPDSLDNGSVHVRDAHHPHIWVSSGVNSVVQPLTHYALPERAACALHAEDGVQESISHFTAFPIDPPIVTVSRNELEDSNVVGTLKITSHHNSLE